MMEPKLALCNFYPETNALRRTALAQGFCGVDWTFKTTDLPRNDWEEARLIREVSRLQPLEVRYHCAFPGVDLGDDDAARAEEALETFRHSCRLVSRLEGRYMTVHLGLGRDTTEDLCWDRTLDALGELVDYGREQGVQVCLENLAWGWSSRPPLFEKLVRKSGAGVTLDIGHAQVCDSVQSRQYDFEDFVTPHASRVFNAHVYHEERHQSHVPPQAVDDVCDRLRLLRALPCDWWVLELREETALLETLRVVRRFLESESCECEKLVY